MDPLAICKPPRNNFYLIPILVKSKLCRAGATLEKIKEFGFLEILSTRF